MPSPIAFLTRSIPLAATLLCAAGAANEVAAQEEPDRISVIDVAPNPEDLVRLPGSPWIVVSSMADAAGPGRLFVMHEDAGRDSRQAIELFPAGSKPASPRFGPHGLNVRTLGDGDYELLVVDHGDIEAVTLLRLKLLSASAPPIVTQTRRVPAPEGVWANGVVATPDGGFLVTSMYDPRDAGFIDKFAQGRPTGSIWAWRDGAGWSQWSPLAFSGANGVAISPDGAAVFVSEWARRRIWRLPFDQTAPPAFVEVGFLPDNLRWSDDGDLLTAGQAADPEAVFGCQIRPTPCPMGYVVARIDPATLDMLKLAEADGEDVERTGFGGATVALLSPVFFIFWPASRRCRRWRSSSFFAAPKLERKARTHESAPLRGGKPRRAASGRRASRAT